MPEFELEESLDRRNGVVPILPAPNRGVPNVHADERVALQQYLAELDVYYQALKVFAEQEPDMVLQQVAAFSGRLCEIRARLQRMGTTRANQLRTREVDPLMEQMDFQFRIASRLLSMREFEFKASGGGV
jgi:hypothetical protein